MKEDDGHTAPVSAVSAAPLTPARAPVSAVTSATLASADPAIATLAAAASPTAAPALDDNLHWYKDAVIYELHIKAFCDGNGDGIGDFHGLLQKLDYLQDLGVTAIWLLPFYPSPLKDDGYDIADYYSINPAYGDIPLFTHFLKEAHRRGLKVITELVINHTSDQHPWFQRARNAPKGSKERNYYVWTDDPTQYKDVRIIFQDFETSNWTWDPVADQYYWHRFFHHQPDLNYDSPQVQAEVFRIITFWCRLGVDGFRLDAVPYLYEREGTNGENLPETHAFLKKLRRHVDQHFPGTVFLAEANMWPEDAVSYFGDGDECQMNYHFPVMPRMFMSLQMEDRYPLTDIFEQTPDIPATCQWALFLRNHDELTLEMVTDEERDYMYQAYARDPKAKINMGIRHRLAPLLGNNRRKMELMNALLLSLPGTPVLYYGDEIGMGDNFYLGDRDGVRTPMQWSPDRNAGFSGANPQKLYLPLILDPEYHYEAVNVETQRANTSSLFWYMKRIISVRKKFRVFGRGDLKFLSVENPKALAFTRSYGEETLLVVVNLSKFSQAAELDLSAYKGYVPVDVFSNNRFPVIKEDGLYFFTLAPHACHWFLMEKAHPEMDVQAALPLLILRQWKGLMESDSKTILENSILPRYLPKANWYLEGQRMIYSVGISDFAEMEADGNTLFWLLLEVAYQNGLPGVYQLPVLFIQGERAEKFAQSCPRAVIAQVRTADAEGLLVDAFFTAEGQLELFRNMADKKIVKGGAGEHRHGGANPARIVFSGSPALRQHLQTSGEPRPRVHISDEYNTAISYNGSFFLKMYRKVDTGINPDLEITQFLSGEAKFKHIPAYIGSITWESGKSSIVLGIMQEMIENHGDGYSFFMERINNYIERLVAGNAKTIVPGDVKTVVPGDTKTVNPGDAKTVGAKRVDAKTRAIDPDERLGTLAAPLAFAELPEALRELIGAHAAEQAHLLGIRTAEMHLALASGAGGKDFRPEPFSLYYQRSLYSSMQSLVRRTYQHFAAVKDHLPPVLQERKERILAYRPELLTTLKKIYTQKLDALKIRIHGNFQLKRVLLTGKDLSIQDFGGDPVHSSGERRLKRSPLTDLACMVASIYEVAYEGFLLDHPSVEIDIAGLLPFAPFWAHYISGFFVKAWFDTVNGSALVPPGREDRVRIWQNYLLQQAISDFNRALGKDPERAVIPMAMLRAALALGGAT